MGEGKQREERKTSSRGRERERYGVIETVTVFVRCTCQGQVKTAFVREVEREKRMGEERRVQLESGSQ